MRLRESVRALILDTDDCVLLVRFDWDGQVDHIHLYRTERFQPAPAMSPAQLEAEHVHDIAWWSPDELAMEGVTFAPRSLPRLLAQLHRDGVSAAPIGLSGF